jgi:3-oxoacyl-[acyl-carrier-protein] synthase-3
MDRTGSSLGIGLSAVTAVLPPHSLALAELAAERLLTSPAENLAALGFERAFLADSAHDAGSLALSAARAALAEASLEPEAVDVLIWASALPWDHLRPDAGVAPARDEGELLRSFRYASGWLQEELGLDRASVTAVAQQGCASMFAALRQARALLLAEPRLETVLCVGVDVLPPGSPREILHNVISDGACAVVVARGELRDRWLGYRQISKGYYWDPLARRAEILAAYFPTAKVLVEELLSAHGLAPGEVDVVVPTGVQRGSWEILLDLVGIPAGRAYLPRESFGHTVVADNFLLLEELRRSGRVPPGARLLLFTYGFGSSWCGLLLEH